MLVFVVVLGGFFEIPGRTLTVGIVLSVLVEVGVFRRGCISESPLIPD
jgi:hypothetical protein